MPDLVPTFEIVMGGVVAAFFVLLLILETRFPLRQAKRGTLKRFVINAAVSGLALASGAYVVAPIALELLARPSETSFGLLHVIALPAGAKFVVGFLLMDLSFYYWHRANHVFSLFWRFHNVHHIDQDLDVSTSFRFHFGEVLYSSGFRVLQVYLIGISLFTFLVYELVFHCATLLHHSNVRLPITFELALNKIIVTPRMHGIHHSMEKDETNSNYSVIFRWWDWMHRTLRLNVKQSDAVIGVPAYCNPEDNKLLNLFVLPFRKQREYWRSPNAKQSEKILVNKTENILLP